MIFHNVPAFRRKLNLLDYLYDYFVAHSATHIIAVSQVLKEALISRRKFPSNKISVIYCGLEDQSPLLPEEVIKKKRQLQLNPDDYLLLISGQYTELRKGHEFLFRALSEVTKKIPNLKLLIAGEGSEQRKDFLTRLAVELGIQKNLIFLGYRTDIHELNCIVDIAIIPSIGDEATPYTIKEAARAAKPVITTIAGGCAEAVIPKKTGVLVKPENTQELAFVIIQLLLNEQLRKRMGIEGRALFLSRFLLQKTLGEISSFF